MKISFPKYNDGVFSIINISINNGWAGETVIEFIFLNLCIDITFNKP